MPWELEALPYMDKALPYSKTDGVEPGATPRQDLRCTSAWRYQSARHRVCRAWRYHAAKLTL
jgi:hypothetical protein